MDPLERIWEHYTLRPFRNQLRMGDLLVDEWESIEATIGEAASVLHAVDPRVYAMDVDGTDVEDMMGIARQMATWLASLQESMDEMA